MHLIGCARFWLWALAGALATFAVVGSLSIGVFFVPPTIAAIWLAFRAGPAWPEAVGVLAGAAAICLFVAYLQRGDQGLDAQPWLVAGIVLAIAGIGGYAALSRRALRGLGA